MNRTGKELYTAEAVLDQILIDFFWLSLAYYFHKNRSISVTNIANIFRILLVITAAPTLMEKCQMLLNFGAAHFKAQDQSY